MLLVVYENLLVPLSNYKLVMFMEPIICPIPDFFTQNYQNKATCRYINPSHPITYETNLTTLRIKLIDLVKSRGNTTSKKQALAKLLYNMASITTWRYPCLNFKSIRMQQANSGFA